MEPEGPDGKTGAEILHEDMRAYLEGDPLRVALYRMPQGELIQVLMGTLKIMAAASRWEVEADQRKGEDPFTEPVSDEGATRAIAFLEKQVEEIRGWKNESRGRFEREMESALESLLHQGLHPTAAEVEDAVVGVFDHAVEALQGLANSLSPNLRGFGTDLPG